MNKRIILAVVIIIFIIILALAGYYIYSVYSVKTIVETNVNLTNTPASFNVNAVQNNQNINSSNQPQADVSKDDSNKIRSLAIIFSQNFGSYSNQTNLTNFDDLFGLMSATMKKWILDTYKAQIIEQHPQSEYYAIETKVLNVTITKIDEAKNTAVAMLNTQRQEFVGSPDNVDVFNQDLLLNLMKVNGEWIVDSAYWQ